MRTFTPPVEGKLLLRLTLGCLLLLLVFGIWTRMAAVVIAINMMVAVALVHMGQLATLTTSGGWQLELQAFFLATALAIALLGAGHLSFGGAQGRWN